MSMLYFSWKLLYLGREWPDGYTIFRDRCKRSFMRNIDADQDKARQLVARGEFVIKEIEALYRLKKYRTLKKRYYSE